MNFKILQNTLSYIKNHETSRLLGSGVPRFFLWQLQTRLLGVTDKEILWVNNSKLKITKGRPTSTANYYVGMSDFQEMGLLCHFLRNDDLVGDVGANIGIYTVLCGKALGARVIAFEPDQTTVRLLHDNIRLNNIESRTIVKDCAIGSNPGVISFTKGLDAINHVGTSNEEEIVANVMLDTLDNVFSEEAPAVLKIDVEGFETEALKGAERILGDPNLKVIIIELNGLGQRYGFNDKDIDNMLLSFGFSPYEYTPIKRILTKTEYNINTGNYIYLRDLDFVKARIQSSELFTIWGKRI